MNAYLTTTEITALVWVLASIVAFCVTFLGGLFLAVRKQERAPKLALVADLRPERPATAVDEPILLRETYVLAESELADFRREALDCGWFIVCSGPINTREYSVTIGQYVWDTEDAHEWSISGDMFPGRVS